MDFRWRATATYRTEWGPIEVEHDFEELHDLHDLIERGPDWRALDSIVVRLIRTDDEVRTLEDAAAWSQQRMSAEDVSRFMEWAKANLPRLQYNEGLRRLRRDLGGGND